MEPNLRGSHMTTFANQHGRLHSDVGMKSNDLPKLNLEPQRIVYHSVMDREEITGEDRWSSFMTPPGLGIVSDVYCNPQVPLDRWQACKHTETLCDEIPSPINPSPLCEALWKSPGLCVKDISPTVEIGNDNQVYDRTPLTWIDSPIFGNGFWDDLPNRSGIEPLFIQSQDQIAYDAVGDSWLIDRWYLDVKGLPLIEDYSSHNLPSAPDESSIGFESIDSCPQQTSRHQTSTAIDLCLASATGPTTYESTSPSARWCLSPMEGDHQWCHNSASDTPELRRHVKDEFLIYSKRSGMSYREIRTKGRFKEAESTLRGRYRTLTKCKEQRVRKPQWHAKDVSLQGFDKAFSNSDRQSRSYSSAKPWLKLVQIQTLSEHGNHCRTLMRPR